jgi:hypothetical protein
VLIAVHDVCIQAATAGLKQEVKIKVQSTDGDDENECTFQGVKNPLVITGGGLGFMNQEAVVIAADDTNDRQIELDFKVFKNGASTASKIKDYKKDTVGQDIYLITRYAL